MTSTLRLLVLKSKRQLLVVDNQQTLHCFTIDLGRQPIGAKEFEGDNKTPEGLFSIDSKNQQSAYFLNLGIDYPKTHHKQYALKQGKSPGGQIKIHGQPNHPDLLPHYPCADWTAGCVALSNKDMQLLFDLIEIGTEIEIRP